MVPLVAGLDRDPARQFALNIERPAHGVGIDWVGVVERNTLSQKCGETIRRSHRLADAGGERITESCEGCQIAIVRGHKRGALAETGLDDAGSADGEIVY